MKVAFACLCQISALTLGFASGVQAGTKQPSLLTLRNGSLNSLIPGNLRREWQETSSAVRFELRNSPHSSLDRVNLHVSPSVDCQSPEGIEPDEELAELTPGVYQLTFGAEGYNEKSSCFIALAEKGSTLQMTVGGDEDLEVRQILDVDPLVFQKSRSTLMPVSYPVLDDLVKLLKENPRIIRLEVGVHTDSGGQHWSNMKLTNARAQKVAQYLIQQGIDSSRIEASGYGSLMPIAEGTSPEARIKNRRVEFVVRDVAPRKTTLMSAGH